MHLHPYDNSESLQMHGSNTEKAQNASASQMRAVNMRARHTLLAGCEV